MAASITVTTLYHLPQQVQRTMPDPGSLNRRGQRYQSYGIEISKYIGAGSFKNDTFQEFTNFFCICHEFLRVVTAPCSRWLALFTYFLLAPVITILDGNASDRGTMARPSPSLNPRLSV